MKYDICIAAGPYNKLGGIERYNVELVDALHRAGHKVYIIATKVDYPTDNIEQVITINTNLFFPALNFIVNSIKASLIYRRFKKDHPEGLFIANGITCLYSDFMLMQSVHRQAIIVTNAREPKTPKGYFKKLLRRVRPINVAILCVEWFGIKFGSKRVIAIANKVKREVVALYGVSDNKVVVVHSGVNAKEFIANPETRETVRGKASFSKDDFLLLFSGNEFKRKGLAYLIEALSRIDDPRVKLVVAGKARDGAFKDMADKFGVGERVFFIGPRSDFPDWCAACDAFVFPTLDEPFGLVIAEALAAGLPTITSGPKYAGASECLQDEVDAILLEDPTDVGNLTKCIQRVVSNPDLRSKLSKNGRAAAERLSWERVASGIVDAWTACLQVK